MHAAYATAIELIVSGNIDYKRLGIELAKDNPELFVKLAQSTPTILPWHTEVVKQHLANNRIAGIKTIRCETGYGLKEAKDVSDTLLNRLIKEGMVKTPGFTSDPHYYDGCTPDRLPSDQREVYGRLCAAAGLSQ